MKTITIGKICSHAGCQLVGTVARKCGDFWVVTCERHTSQRILLDFAKIPSEKADPRVTGAGKRT